MDIRNILRIGKVSAVNGPACSARVTFADKDNLVSAELPVLQPASMATKAYSLPEVGTQVLCAFLPHPSGRGVNDGFILGAYYSAREPPAEQDEAVKSIRFADGSHITYDHGNITIHATGTVTITGAEIKLN